MTFDSEVYTLVDYKLVYSRANEILATSSAITDFLLKQKDLFMNNQILNYVHFIKQKKISVLI